MSISWKPGLVALIVVGVASCDASLPSGKGGFQDQYTVSRSALEAGDYTKALRGYAKLMDEAGPHEPRIRLEFAHSLLRSNAFQQAASEAGVLAKSQTGDARAAALAVQGTAEHELALVALRTGDADGAGAKHLKAAQQALAEVLKDHPGFDPVGSLAMRKRSIDAALR